MAIDATAAAPCRPAALNLSNWRQGDHGRWAFHHVREIVPSERIARDETIAALPRDGDDALVDLALESADGRAWSLAQWLAASSSDALLIAHRGRIQHEWYANPAVEEHPHIAFSVSKSITAMLAGALVGDGLLDPAGAVIDYLPELDRSGFADARVQHLLDMSVCIDFDEDYLATSGKMLDYRSATGWHPCEVADIDRGLHDFLRSIERAAGEHGETWRYKSPNSDLLGWILERAAGERLATLLSDRLWRPMGAEGDACVTLDRKGAARAAGGICVLPRDLLRFAELVRQGGFANGRRVVPESWVRDCSNGGSVDAWRRGDSTKDFPGGSYRNQWYQTGNAHRAMLAIGIHSQWIYIDPVDEVSIVKLSAQEQPLNPELDAVNLRAFGAICERFSAA